VAQVRVSDLPFGTQKRVELARALAAEPQLLLLDEPASGLNHEEVGALGALIRSIRERLRLTVLLVEHHMGLVMSISDRVVALNFGRKIAEGHARRGARAPRADQGLPGRGRVMGSSREPMLLEVKALHASYGPTRVLHGIDFGLDEGSITTLLGAKRRGQDDHLARAVRHGEDLGRDPLRRQARGRPPDRGHCAPGCRARARRPRHVSPT